MGILTSNLGIRCLGAQKAGARILHTTIIHVRLAGVIHDTLSSTENLGFATPSRSRLLDAGLRQTNAGDTTAVNFSTSLGRKVVLEQNDVGTILRISQALMGGGGVWPTELKKFFTPPYVAILSACKIKVTPQHPPTTGLKNPAYPHVNPLY